MDINIQQLLKQIWDRRASHMMLITTGLGRIQLLVSIRHKILTITVHLLKSYRWKRTDRLYK